MVRAPCCEKMGLKKGPWTPEEDQVLVSYIQKHGHGNWRALPKQAGLLRCGKSCRLRWINYLRPEIKRGNFTREEEETIIKMHEKLGNRWSAIAAMLPGRTDNEIKNIWHTHLKKKLLKANQLDSDTKKCSKRKIKRSDSSSSTITQSEPASINFPENETSVCTSYSDFSSVDQSKNMDMMTIKSEDIESLETIVPEVEESFWSEAAMDDSSTMPPPLTISNELIVESPIQSVETFQQGYGFSNFLDDGMDFWYDLFITTAEPTDLSEF